MIRSEFLLECITDAGFATFAGVPDSLLKPLLGSLSLKNDSSANVVTANEGAAVAYAVGVYLETSKPAVVYMQNSGLGNAVNPLTALCHRDVYGIPMMLIVGWRGEPGKPDEPQHLVQGKITRQLLSLMDIPHLVLSADERTAKSQVRRITKKMREISGPVAVLVPEGILEANTDASLESNRFTMSREDALSELLSVIPLGDRVVVTTGMLGRELWEFRKRTGASSANDFLVVGGMGHATAVAHGSAAFATGKDVWCLDGDGAMLMHMGNLAVIGNKSPSNFKHVVFNNFSHDSVGGQATSISSVNISLLAESLGYQSSSSTSRIDEVAGLGTVLSEASGPGLLELRVKKGARSDLGRPPANNFNPGAHFPDVSS